MPVLTMVRRRFVFLPLILPFVLSACQTSDPSPSPHAQSNASTISPQSSPAPDALEVIATGLKIPWEIAFLPDGDLLVTERPGNLLRISTTTERIHTISGVTPVGEGGLLGLALHPSFEETGWLYLYLTVRTQGKLTNRVERYRLQDNGLTDRILILENIPAAPNHNGGYLDFGPDGYLYITTGDAQAPNLAQDPNTLHGKILRLQADGSLPPDNPFGNPVYSYGHRNVQGLVWDNRGRLWATEHGPSGIQSGFDEINQITKGGNYGWPQVQGGQSQPGLISPVVQSGATQTWAPAGAAIVSDSLFFTGLRGASLYQLPLANLSPSSLRQHLSNSYGRLRALKLGPDRFLYLTTSNTDGRGQPHQNDDKLIRLNPEQFLTAP